MVSIHLYNHLLMKILNPILDASRLKWKAGWWMIVSSSCQKKILNIVCIKGGLKSHKWLSKIFLEVHSPFNNKSCDEDWKSIRRHLLRNNMEDFLRNSLPNIYGKTFDDSKDELSS